MEQEQAERMLGSGLITERCYEVRVPAKCHELFHRNIAGLPWLRWVLVELSEGLKPRLAMRLLWTRVCHYDHHAMQYVMVWLGLPSSCYFAEFPWLVMISFPALLALMVWCLKLRFSSDANPMVVSALVVDTPVATFIHLSYPIMLTPLHCSQYWLRSSVIVID